jgi:hypothetical protein
MTNDQLIDEWAFGLGQLPFLALRLRFRSVQGHTLQLPESVWRGACKHRLPAEVRNRLMPADAAGPAVTAPGLVLSHWAEGVQLGFFGTAAKDAEAVLGALVAAGLALPQADGVDCPGLGKDSAPAVLDTLRCWRPAQGWQPCAVPLQAGDLARLAAPMGDYWPAVNGAVPRGLLWLETPCSLKHCSEPPTLRALLRALWPRMVGTCQRWHSPQDRSAAWKSLAMQLGTALAEAATQYPWSGGQLMETVWRPVPRPMRSGRQHARWVQEAYTGLLVYKDVAAPVWRVLQLGQAFGLGQGSTVGLGRYSCHALEAPQLA